MKNKLIILLLLISGSVTAQGTWQRLPIPSTVNFNTIFFTDSLTGWIGGEGGIIFHTTDGGNSWVNQSVNSADVTDIFFLNDTLGWATTLNYSINPTETILIKTTDGGATWMGYPYPETNVLMKCVWFLDKNNGWMGGYPHALVRTYNGGKTWLKAKVEDSPFALYPVEAIKFYNHKYGYAAGGIFDVAGVIWSTSDGGETWKTLGSSDAPADEVHGLHLFDSTHVIGAGGDPDPGFGVGIMRSADGGKSWDYQEIQMEGNMTDIDFRTATEAWAPLGRGKKLVYSMDGGSGWTSVNTPDSVSIIKMTFPDPMHGYGTGLKGAFIRYSPSSFAGFEERDVSRILRIYPNPATEKLTIETPAGLKHGFITVKDVSGKTILEKETNSVTTRIDVTGIDPGLYLVIFISPDKGSFSGKVIVRH